MSGRSDVVCCGLCGTEWLCPDDRKWAEKPMQVGWCPSCRPDNTDLSCVAGWFHRPAVEKPDPHRGQHVRTSGRYIEVATSNRPEDWQLRAVSVGKGIEVTRSNRLNGWIEKAVMREWCKAVRALAKSEDWS